MQMGKKKLQNWSRCDGGCNIAIAGITLKYDSFFSATWKTKRIDCSSDCSGILLKIN